MQIKFRKIIFNRISALLSSVFALILMINAANLLTVHKDTETSYSPDSAANSIYLSLDGYAAQKNNNYENDVKMNNQKEKYSNIDTTGTSFHNCKTVRVLDTQSGEVRSEDIEEYTLHALLAEMPQSYEMQALMAQAVACRTYACRNIFYPKHENADVCTDYRCCQSYSQIDDDKTDVSRALFAVEATKGIIASYDGEPILAAYHASSYKKTKSCEEVWGGKKEYLVSVYAPESKSDCSYTVNVSDEKMGEVFEKINKSDVIFMSGSDGICEGAVYGDAFYDCRKIKNLFSLRSDTFEVEKKDGGYAFTCYGYGHGVGMSQKGANLLAISGYDFCEILKYYYKNIKFDFIM